jgi:hypothetical protein
MLNRLFKPLTRPVFTRTLSTAVRHTTCATAPTVVKKQLNLNKSNYFPTTVEEGFHFVADIGELGYMKDMMDGLRNLLYKKKIRPDDYTLERAKIWADLYCKTNIDAADAVKALKTEFSKQNLDKIFGSAERPADDTAASVVTRAITKLSIS